MADGFGFDVDGLLGAFEASDNDNSDVKEAFSSEAVNEEQNDDNQTKRIEEIIAGYMKRKNEECDTEDIDEPKKSKISATNDFSLHASRIAIHKISAGDKCTHEVAVPPEMTFTALKPRTEKPAKTFPFTLDPFQNQALQCIDNNQSVLVSAHTSAGKTVVAEYAIAMGMKSKQRVIYTTPIKALSNQKFRDFTEQFDSSSLEKDSTDGARKKDEAKGSRVSVGLITGDVTINANASILVMTTEILRSMLYRGSEIMREVGWVIFDEIHYMRDKERGVVWEETIILLPDTVHYVFLSATIPNARQFAEWIASLHQQPCHVVYTDYRPVPLQHYVYPAGGDGIHLIVDEKGRFLEENFKKAMNSLDPNEASSKRQKPTERGSKSGFKRNENNCFQIVRLVMERNLEPVIVFSFSKKECEIYALQMAKLDFNSASEKKCVDEVFYNAIDTLSKDDKELPQVESVLPLLKKGIGIHHSGLLPILKETVEILFSVGLIKCLFTTETFAMGLNMPARTVLFTSARKYDGRSYRWITSGEYIQMSGRAGRRGKDDKGTVILMLDESMSEDVGRQIVAGQPCALNSAFYLTYNMILNLVRVEEINPEYMMERSFFQFQNHAVLPEVYEKLRRLREEYEAMSVDSEEEVASYYNLKKCLDDLSATQLTHIRQPKYIVPFMQTGRLIKVKKGDDDFGWGVVVNIKKRQIQERAATPESFYLVECLLRVVKDETHQIRPVTHPDEGEAEVVPIRLECIQAITAVRLNVPGDLRPKANRTSVVQAIEKVRTKLSGQFPLLDPVTDMKIDDKQFLFITEKMKNFQERIDNHWSRDHPRLTELLEVYDKKNKKLKEVEDTEKELENKKSLIQMDELKARKRVLRRLRLCTDDDVLEVKGRVACEIASGDELLLTELLFEGVFNQLNPDQTAALLSCFVFDEKASDVPKLTQELFGPLRTLQRTARHIAVVSRESRVPAIDEEAYVDSFKPTMMDVVAAWAGGASFKDLCRMTDVFEGSVIRCIRRLEELLREMANAAKAIGNDDLEKKFIDAIGKIKRDIVFAPSLYL